MSDLTSAPRAQAARRAVQDREASPRRLQTMTHAEEAFAVPMFLAKARLQAKAKTKIKQPKPKASTPRSATFADDFGTLLENEMTQLKIRLLNSHRRELAKRGYLQDAHLHETGQSPRGDSGGTLPISETRPIDSNVEGCDVGIQSQSEGGGATDRLLEGSQPRQRAVTEDAPEIVPPASDAPLLNKPPTASTGIHMSAAKSKKKERRQSVERSRSLRGSVQGLVGELREAVVGRQHHRLKAALADHRVMVSRQLLKQRLTLEENLVRGTWRLFRWLVCFIPVLIALNVFEPGADIGGVHEMLIHHYGISHTNLLNLKEWDHVYAFFQTFKEQNDLLEPTGKVFWCDPRYLDTLGVTPAGETEFLRQQELAQLGQNSDGNSGSSSSHSSGGRRMAKEAVHSEVNDSVGSPRSALRRLMTSSSSSTGTASTGGHSATSLEAMLLSLKHIYQNPTPLGVDPHGHERFLYDCRIPSDTELLDIHHKLEAARDGNNSSPPTSTHRRRRTDGLGPLDDYKKYFPNEFSESYKAYLNHQYVTKIEPSTGTYLSRFHYPYTAVSLFDPVVYQDRFDLHECSKGTFADYFTNQGFNILSPVFGQSAPKAVDILECVDRAHHVHDEIADDIDTDRYTYQGKHIYARFAGQAGDHTGPSFTDWQRIGWLGKQTETASISVLIYIDALEMFTSLAVHFKQNEGGSIQVTRSVASVVELDDRGTEWAFHLNCALAIFFCVACLVYDLNSCRKLRLGSEMFEIRYPFEVFARLCMLVFIVVIEILYAGRETMKKLFEDAFDTFLYRSDFSHTGQHNAMQHFFEVKEHVQDTAAKHVNIKIMGTFIYVMQIFQLILLLGAHPRVDLLCATIVRTTNGLVHYLLVFVVLFYLLAYYAHWMFSSSLPDVFGSVTDAIMKQTEMIVGYADSWPWEEMKLMGNLQYFCFCMYLFTYFGLVFMILLNFFIAIILEGFFGVWKSLTEDNVGGSGQWLMIDVWHSFRGSCKHRSMKWPKRTDIISRIDTFEREHRYEDTRDADPCLSEAILCQEYGFDTEEEALDFLSTYALKAPVILNLDPMGQRPDKTSRRGKSD